MSRRILLVGASGVFGARLAAMIADWPDAVLVLAARRTGPLEALKANLSPCAATIETATFDRDAPDMAARLAALAPWAVADTAGPFQGAGYGLARAALAAGAHYVDIADGRDFVAGFEAALDADAKAARRVALTGASSTPALTHAALARMTEGWTRIDSVTAAISPGAGAPRGVSVMRAVLSWVGRPVRLFAEGHWREAPGWSRLRRMRFPGLGRRWVSLAETPDLDLMPARFHPRSSGVMLAGLELSVLHLGLWLLSWLVRGRLLKSLVPLAGALRFGAGVCAPFGTDRGGMVVIAEGIGPDGERRWSRWWLAAEAGAGPPTPATPAAAALRALLDGQDLPIGAGPCVGLLPLDAITKYLPAKTAFTCIEAARPDEAGLFPRLMAGFCELPEAVRSLHRGDLPLAAEGRAVARGSAGLAALVRLVLGLPGHGRHAARVEITPTPNGGERWTRRFGVSRFSSSIAPAPDDPGAFEETAGLITFRFRPRVRRDGFAWILDGWRLGPIPLPRAWAPGVRARTVARDGVYRFSVLAAHPLAGVLFAYAGHLQMTTP